MPRSRTAAGFDRGATRARGLSWRRSARPSRAPDVVNPTLRRQEPVDVAARAADHDRAGWRCPLEVEERGDRTVELGSAQMERAVPADHARQRTAIDFERFGIVFAEYAHTYVTSAIRTAS